MQCGWIWLRRGPVNWKRMMAAAVIGGAGLASGAQEADVSTWLPRWSYGGSARTGAGYRDNVTLSHFAPQESAFFLSGLDFSATRLPIDGPQVDLLLTAEDRRFLGDTSVDHETIAFGQAQATTFWGGQWRAGLGAEYLYQDQVLDASVTETNLVAVPALGHTIAARPAVRWDWAETDWLELQFPVQRQLFQAPLDDYWAAGPKLTAAHAYGYSSEVGLSWELTRVAYDDAPELTAGGEPIPGTHRAYTRPEMRLLWRHYWDKNQRWRTATKLVFLLNRDDGSGYFNYSKVQFSQQLRYRVKTWEAVAEAKLADYRYDVQTVSPNDLTKRKRQEFLLNLRAEKHLTKFLGLFAEYEREQTFSNLTIDEYTVNTVSGGLLWEF